MAGSLEQLYINMQSERTGNTLAVHQSDVIVQFLSGYLSKGMPGLV